MRGPGVRRRMEPPRLFTPDEAKALLPSLRPLLAALREAFHDYKFAREQWEEMGRHYGEDPGAIEGHPEHGEAARWRRETDANGQRVQALVDEIVAKGVEVKDPLLGLIDFHHQRANGEIVYLCFRDDEATITHWHPLTTGFRGRRPLSEL